MYVYVYYTYILIYVYDHLAIQYRVEKLIDDVNKTVALHTCTIV